MSAFRSADIPLAALALAERRMIQASTCFRVSLRIAFVVACLSLSVPGDLLTPFVVVACFLAVDWLVSCVQHVEEPAPMDEHAPAAAVLFAAMAAAFRSGSSYDDAAEASTRYCLEIMWCVYCLGLAYHAKRPMPKSPCLLSVLHAQFCGLLLFAGAPPEGHVRFAIRAGMFGLLSLWQYAEVPCHTCLLERRGYLLCFLPVLFIDYAMALVFFCASGFAIGLGDLHSADTWPLASEVHADIV